MRCVRILATALFLLWGAPPSSADFNSVTMAVQRSALAECRVLFEYVPTVVGDDSWAVEQLKKPTTGRAEPESRQEDEANPHDSEGPRVDEEKKDEEEQEKEEEIILTLAALGITDTPDASAMLILGGLANYSTDDIGTEFDLQRELTDEELRLALQEIPELAVRMADALIAFSDGLSRLALKLASLLSRSSGESWASIFANREDLRSHRAQQVRHITTKKTDEKDSDKKNDEISSSVKKVVRSTFKIFLGVCIGLLLLMFMRQGR